MLSFLQPRIANTRVGLEFRQDGFALALYRSARYSSLKNIESYWFSCPPAKRLPLLSQVVEQLGLRNCRCDVAIALGDYRRFEIERPNVPESELRDAAHWASRKVIDDNIDELQIEYFDYPESALRGRQARLNIRAAKQAMLQSFRQTVRSANLDLVSIQPVDLSFKNLAALIHPSDQIHLFLKLEDNSALLFISKGVELFFTREFNFNASRLNEGDTSLQELAIEVQRSVDFFEAQTGIITPKKIHLLSLMTDSEQERLASLLGYSKLNLPLQGKLKGLEAMAEASTVGHLKAQGAVAALCQAYTGELAS